MGQIRLADHGPAIGYNPHMPSHIFLSPHLDDAVFSCGGVISHLVGEGNLAKVFTVCAGDPPPGKLSQSASDLHMRWGESENPLSIRRQEDLAACSTIGAQAVHLEVPDAIYRLSEAGDALYGDESAIFGVLHRGDVALVGKVAKMIEVNLEDGDII